MRFSFLSPVYNSEQWVRSMLDSIPKEYADEIIVCDDGSTDQTLAMLKEYQQQYPQLKILENGENRGASYSYNRCIEAATGDYIAIIDSDDIYLPTIREVLAKIDGEYDIYYYSMVTKDGQLFQATEENYREWCGQFRIIKRSCVGEARFSERPDMAGDCDFHQALLDQNPSVHITGIIAYWYNYPRINSEYYLYYFGLK